MLKVLLLLVVVSQILQDFRQPSDVPRCEVVTDERVRVDGEQWSRVNNLDLIRIEAWIPRTLSPSEGNSHRLEVDAAVYILGANGTRKKVPSAVNGYGGGGNADSQYLGFYLDIPVDLSEREEAIRRYIDDVIVEAREAEDTKTRDLLAALSARLPDTLARVFRQHRVGQFDVECLLLYPERVVSAGHTKLEVEFEGNFFDQEAFRNK